MACATLKRSLDWDPYNSPANAGPQTTRPAKRVKSQFGDRTQFAQSSTPPIKEPSPFQDVNPTLTADEIANTIKEEMRRLHNRKQLHFGQQATSSGHLATQPLSINLSSPSGSQSPECSSPSSSSNVLSLPGMHSPNRREQPLFTFKQVGLICEKLVKERETQIREEYDKVLGSKLSEQYDTFVKFTYEQIQKRYASGETPSYLS